MPAPAMESLPAMVSVVRMAELPDEDEEILIRQKLVLLHELQAGGLRLRDHDTRRHSLFGSRPRAAFALAVVDDADASLSLQRSCNVLQQHDRVFRLMKGIDDEH